MAVYPISPCHPDLGYVRQSPTNWNAQTQPVEVFKESWDGPKSGMLERRSSLREKGDKRYSFPTKRKLSFLSSGSVILVVLLFSKWRRCLGAVPLCFYHLSMVPQHKKQRLHFLAPDRSTQLFRVDELCASLSDSPGEFIYFDCPMSCNCIAADDGSSLVIYKSVDLSVSTSFLQYHLDES